VSSRLFPRASRADGRRPAFDWFVGVETVRITAGTSTPDEIIEGVEIWLKDFAEFQEKLAVTQIRQPHAPC